MTYFNIEVSNYF